MDVVISANSESPLLSSLERNLVSDMYTYRLSQNASNQSKSVVEVLPQTTPTGSTHGQTMRFKIPRYGLLAKCVLEATPNTTNLGAGTNNQVRLGERLYSNVELRSHNRIISSQGPEYCSARIDNLSQEANNAYSSVTQPSPAFPGSGTVTSTVYTPLFFPFFEKTSNFLDVKFTESLELSVTVNTSAAMGLLGDFNSCTYKLYCWYVNLSQEAEQAYISKNFPANAPFTMLSYNQYTEVPVIELAPGAGERTVEVDLKTNNAVFATHIMVQKSDTKEYVPVNEFTLTATGRELVKMNDRLNIFDTGSYGVSASTSGASSGSNIEYNAAAKALTYYWGMSRDRSYNSGAAAFQNLNAPRATVKYTAAGSQNYTITVVHEYYNYISINPSDGSILSGISS